MVYMLQIVILLNLSLQSIRNEYTMVITGIVECCLAPLSVSHILANLAARRAKQSPNMTLYIHLYNCYSIGKSLLLFLTHMPNSNIIRINPDFITLFQILCCSFPAIVTSADELVWFSGDELCDDTLGWITQS